jgi:hypothetical protein
LPTPLRRYSGYDDLSSDVNLAANRNVRYHGLNNNEKILGLLESGSIGSLKASLYLDKSVELGLSELVVQKLKEAIELNAKSFNSISTYKVDEEGMVSFERAKEDEGHQARIKVDGTYMCQKCSRLSRLSAGELAVCSRCSKGPVVPFKLY